MVSVLLCAFATSTAVGAEKAALTSTVAETERAGLFLGAYSQNYQKCHDQEKSISFARYEKCVKEFTKKDEERSSKGGVVLGKEIILQQCRTDQQKVFDIRFQRCLRNKAADAEETFTGKEVSRHIINYTYPAEKD